MYIFLYAFSLPGQDSEQTTPEVHGRGGRQRSPIQTPVRTSQGKILLLLEQWCELHSDPHQSNNCIDLTFYLLSQLMMMDRLPQSATGGVVDSPVQSILVDQPHKVKRLLKEQQFTPETTRAYFIVDWDTINTILGSCWHQICVFRYFSIFECTDDAFCIISTLPLFIS